ncbi:MAG: peptidoglycan-binding protein [Candidatus Cloacimonetes bacterium]|nr:peptidoglycan-binding protein [Candidatus Cloacimonadota bacterium]
MPLLPIIFAASLFSFFMSKGGDSPRTEEVQTTQSPVPVSTFQVSETLPVETPVDTPTVSSAVLRDEPVAVTPDEPVIAVVETPVVSETVPDQTLPVLGFHPEGAEDSPVNAFDDFGASSVSAPVSSPSVVESTATTTAAVEGTGIVYYCAFESPYSFGRYNKPTLIASKWSAVGEVQRALRLTVDGKFGRGTKDAILEYQREKGLSGTGCIDDNLMAALLPSMTRPDFRERASQLSYLFEGTDYDVVQFNWPGGDGTNDGQGLTWGPTGMTLASGEIVSILKLAVGQHRALLAQVLGEADTSALAQIASMNTNAAMIHVKRTYFDPGRSARGRLKAMFVKLGGIPEVRQCFDQISRKSIDDKMRYYVNYMKEFNDITELDYAMFYDISVQTGKPVQKVKALRDKVRPGSALKGAERRKVWGQTISSMVSSAWRQNRELRNRSFYSETAMAGRYGLAERPINL